MWAMAKNIPEFETHDVTLTLSKVVTLKPCLPIDKTKIKWPKIFCGDSREEGAEQLRHIVGFQEKRVTSFAFSLWRQIYSYCLIIILLFALF